LIRAASVIAEDDEIIIIGSQSVLGQFPEAPASLLVSVEADMYPKNHPERADLIDGSIGELSPFHETFGYYAQGVGETTAKLPEGWKARLVPIRNENTRGATGWCLEVHDLALAKYAAGREKDNRFTAEAARHGLIQRAILDERRASMPLDAQRAELVAQRIAADFAAHGRRPGA
jgi:hypothetical protein